MPVISALGKLRQEDLEFETSWGTCKSDTNLANSMTLPQKRKRKK
jgi:hypothetical protein